MIGDMIGAALKTNVTALTAVRPVFAKKNETFPYGVYETSASRNSKRLNCPSNRHDANIRIFICSQSYAQVQTLCEQAKTLFADFSLTGTDYRIARTELLSEGDILEDEDEDNRLFFVKSLDFEVIARKL